MHIDIFRFQYLNLELTCLYAMEENVIAYTVTAFCSLAPSLDYFIAH